MEPSKENQLVKLAVPTSSYESLLECQKDILLNQVENLQHILATQCQLTGVNPLAQEMAAGALSIKIGKKPRDLLNPKAVKYMQFVFSIKDAISKRETREISAQFGVTVTQVRDFFASQRARVRKFASLSSVKVDKSVSCDAMPDNMASTSDPNVPAEPIPLDTVAPMEEEPSCSMRHEVLPGMEEADRNFTDNIFRLMRKEESFAGRLKLLQWILRTENPSVLNWFLTEGGVLIIATWLSEAAAEEQTSVLRLILKVLCYLPLKKALPVHMSAVLQSVNTLRFYRTPDVSNRSRILLAQWSSTVLKGIALNKSRSVSDAQDEMLLKQSIDEVMSNQSWGLKDDNSEEALRFLCHNPDYQRKLDPAQPMKLLTASEDDTNKKRGALSSHTRERRKVQMVEHPGQKSAARHPQVAKSPAATQSRPLSADDIQKAKMRAQFLQSKHGKTIGASDDQVKPESQNGGVSLPAKVSPSVTTYRVLPEPEERRKVENPLTKAANPPETLNVEEPPRKKYKRNETPWRAPPEVKIMDEWHVGSGDNSKEVEIQRNRIKREREIIYRTAKEIPSNPREPWDREMDYDDTLTPEIPIEQLPDVEPLETPTASGINEHVTAIASSSSTSMPEPDLELLAELLKNPQLVFALTSGQAGDLSSNDTVRLLDVIKSNGASVLASLAGVNGTNSNVEVSLPSPTPSSDVVPNGVKPDYSRNPFSRQHAMTNGNAYHQATQAVLPIRPHQTVPTSTLVQPQVPGSAVSAHRVSPVVQQLAHTAMTHEQWHTVNSPNIQQLNPENMINVNHNAYSVSSHINHEPVARLSPHLPYSQEPNSLRTRLGFESIHHHQNNITVNNYNAYDGGNVQQARAWDGRNNLGERPGYESWSPDNSPSRRHEYIPTRNYQEPRGSLGHGYMPERVMPPPPSGYRDQGLGGAGNKRWRDNGR